LQTRGPYGMTTVILAFGKVHTLANEWYPVCFRNTSLKRSRASRAFFGEKTNTRPACVYFVNLVER